MCRREWPSRRRCAAGRAGGRASRAPPYAPGVSEELRVHRTEGVVEVTFDRPQRHNAFTREMYAGMRALCDELHDDTSVKVLVLGSYRVDLALLRERLVAAGLRHILSEGGPHLLRDLVDQGVADELDSTVVPRLLAGEHARMTNGPPVDVPLRLHTLLEDRGTLLARWLV